MAFSLSRVLFYVFCEQNVYPMENLRLGVVCYKCVLFLQCNVRPTGIVRSERLTVPVIFSGNRPRYNCCADSSCCRRAAPCTYRSNKRSAPQSNRDQHADLKHSLEHFTGSLGDFTVLIALSHAQFILETTHQVSNDSLYHSETLTDSIEDSLEL